MIELNEIQYIILCLFATYGIWKLIIVPVFEWMDEI